MILIIGVRSVVATTTTPAKPVEKPAPAKPASPPDRKTVPVHVPAPAPREEPGPGPGGDIPVGPCRIN